MAAISGASVTPAAQPAATLGNLVNTPVGYPAQEKYPGPVSPSQYTDAGPEYPIEGPPAGGWVLADVPPGSMPQESPGGGVQDTSWLSGHDAPMLPWDSSAGAPFAPSGALNPDLHAQDTGAVFQAQHVTPAGIGQLIRVTVPGQTYNREYAFDPVNGQYVPQPNGRTDYDQQQRWNPHPYDDHTPWQPGYAERPIYNNVAYQATQVNEVPGIYGVNGALPNLAPVNTYAASAYEAPPEPIVNQPAAPAADLGGGWVLG